MHPVAPCSLWRPAVQLVQSMLPTSNVPASHTVHVNRLVFLEPAAHLVQVPLCIPPQPVRMKPAAHAAHISHTALPEAGWNSLLEAEHAEMAEVPLHFDPAGQAAHSRSACSCPAFVSYCPARQMV